MSDEAQIDQEVYDRLIAEGKSERIARAKAKAAAVRKAKIAEGQSLGPKSADDAKKALEEFKAGAGSGGGAATKTATATAEEPSSGRLSPEERQARVAASLGGGGEQASMGVPASSDTHTACWLWCHRRVFSRCSPSRWTRSTPGRTCCWSSLSPCWRPGRCC